MVMSFSKADKMRSKQRKLFFKLELKFVPEQNYI